MWGRVLVCCILAACAGDNRLDPGDLELRDVLGVAPETAMAWDAGQRAAARRVIDTALHDAPSQATLATDRSVEKALAVADADREKRHLRAMGVVALDPQQATSRTSTLAPRAALPIELKFAGWSDRPGWAELPARGIDVLSTLATDAGHRNGPVVVTPAPRLPVIAGYLPGNPARLVVNPVLLAALEPRPGSPTVVASDPIANPYTFYASVGECAAAQRTRCEACLPNGTCTPLTGIGDGMAECRQLATGDGRGYSLVCINFALAIDSVASCTAANSGCPIDPHAAESISSLDHNADFLDRAECANPLDYCLEVHAGTAPASTPPSSQPSTSCDASGCDASGCDGACEDSGDDSCSSSDSSDGCDGGDSGGDCSGGDSGGDCGGDSGGDCGGDSGGDCGGGGGGDCAGDSGGDCSGGGGSDCNAGGTRSHGYLWACLPLPFAVIARRRADRRRARAEVQS